MNANPKRLLLLAAAASSNMGSRRGRVVVRPADGIYTLYDSPTIYWGSAPNTQETFWGSAVHYDTGIMAIVANGSTSTHMQIFQFQLQDSPVSAYTMSRWGIVKGAGGLVSPPGFFTCTTGMSNFDRYNYSGGVGTEVT